MSTNVPGVQATQPADTEVKTSEFKSKYGYHCCSYETFDKLRRLKKRFYQILSQEATHWRWERKETQNRVIRTYRRNEKGQRIGVLSKVEMPEPSVCRELSTARQRWILTLFEDARMPKEIEQKPIDSTTLASINELHAKTEAWFVAAGKE